MKARRIGTLLYSVYAARSYSVKAAARLPWITYDDTLAHLPQAKWIAKAASGSVDNIYRLRVHDAETAMESVLAGLGKTLLPTLIGERESHVFSGLKQMLFRHCRCGRCGCSPMLTRLI